MVSDRPITPADAMIGIGMFENCVAIGFCKGGGGSGTEILSAVTAIIKFNAGGTGVFEPVFATGVPPAGLLIPGRGSEAKVVVGVGGSGFRGEWGEGDTPGR